MSHHTVQPWPAGIVYTVCNTVTHSDLQYVRQGEVITTGFLIQLLLEVLVTDAVVEEPAVVIVASNTSVAVAAILRT